MGKASRTKAREKQAVPGEVGPRQPCPCGSGKRYKNCHGDPAAAPAYVARPFEGMPSEADVVAMRELVPAATAPLHLAGEHADRSVQLCSLLPGASPALVREGGEIWLGLQVQHNFGDPARDLGAVLQQALIAEPGPVGLTEAPGLDVPRLQDQLDQDSLEVTVHEGFDFWVDDLDDPDGTVAATLEQANQVAQPTARLTGVTAAYWTSVGSKEHLRWVLPEPEDRVLDALARLHVAGRDVLVEGARLVGMFRAHGLLTPVWDLPVGTGPEALEDPAEEFRAALDSALADDAPLSPEERSTRSSLATRQVTIR